MKRFTKAVRESLKNENWYSALSVALTLPDICGKLEKPNTNTRKRYIEWYNEYMLHKYTSHIGRDQVKHIFLKGEDCYALRCSYLHEGKSDISDQRVKEVLENFHFIVPPPNSIKHRNQVDSILQLQIDCFCEDICCGVEDWLEKMKETKPKVIEGMDSLLEIHPTPNF